MIRTALGAAVFCAAAAFVVAAIAAVYPPTPRDEPITAIPAAPHLDPRKVALGERLYRSAALSDDGQRSCQSCHYLESNGATDERFDLGADGRPVALNTPTVFNSALSYRLNWEGNQRSLEELVIASFHNPQIMSVGPKGIGRMKSDPSIAKPFRAAYGRDVDEQGLADAIAVFMRTLVTPGGRFDRWLQGDAHALSTEELRGYAKFKSLGCVSCHQGVNVGGNLFQKHGVFHPLAAPLPPVLRVPSLRNVAATAPYFHDGSATTLHDAVWSMGHAQLDLSLSKRDVDDIVAFLGTLSGPYKGRPTTPPHSR